MAESPVEGALICPITALKITRLAVSPEDDAEQFDCVLAGCGPELRIFRLGNDIPVACRRVFLPGIRIHGISCGPNNQFFLYGDRFVVKVAFDMQAESRLTVLNTVKMQDWVFVASWIPALNAVAFGIGHGRICVCSPGDLRIRAEFRCAEKELSWSAAVLFPEKREEFIAVHGTCFGDILLWPLLENEESISAFKDSIRTDDSAVVTKEASAQRLKSHDGPVMSLRFSAGGELLVSASVDRSVRVWKRLVRNRTFENKSNTLNFGNTTLFEPFLVHYGHLARIWDACFMDSCSASVVSVGEDRTCKIWSSTENSTAVASFQGHDGRNVWCVDVLHADNKVLVATGGEDGVVKVRQASEIRNHLEHETDGENSTANGSASRVPLAELAEHVTGHELPKGYENPRKSSGEAKHESARTILVLNEWTVLVSTDFGRVLAGHVWNENVGQGKSVDIKWTSLYCDKKGVAFAPNALSASENCLFAGQTNGFVVVLRNTGFGAGMCLSDMLFSFAATGRTRRMVMGLSSHFEKCSGITHLFVMSPHGEVLHWLFTKELVQETLFNENGNTEHEINAVEDSNQATDREEALPKALLLATYMKEQSKKQLLCTCVRYLECCKVLIVGDRGGGIGVYSCHRDGAVNDDNGRDSNMNMKGNIDRIRRPLCSCRPHTDRVTSITCIRSACTTSSDEVSEWTCDHELVSSAFDGRVSHLRLRVKRCSNSGAGFGRASIEVMSLQRSIERVDTLSRVVYARSKIDNTIVTKRACILGFRSTDMVLWDLAERNEIFRVNCGNWRRAYDVHVDLQCNGSENGSELDVHFGLIAYWRACKLHIVRYPCGAQHDDEHCEQGDKRLQGALQTMSFGAAFHGQRANAMECIVDQHENEHVLRVVTAGEDTVLRIMRVDTRISACTWRCEQTLTQHISGVYCVSRGELCNSSMKVLVSGGGCDEIAVWIAECYKGAWRNASVIRGIEQQQQQRQQRRVGNAHNKNTRATCTSSSKAVQRILCAKCMPTPAGAQRAHQHCACVSFVIGRSDGSVCVLRTYKTPRKAHENDAVHSTDAWTTDVLHICRAHTGAVLSIAVEKEGDRTDSEKFVLVSGDSAGYVHVWEIRRTSCCESLQIQRRSTVCNAHVAGVLDVDVLRVGNKIMCVTAGDDGVVTAFIAHSEHNQFESAGEHVSRMQISSASICGVRMLRKHAHHHNHRPLVFHIVSVAADQKLRCNLGVLQCSTNVELACDVGHIVIGHALVQRTVDVVDCACLLVNARSANQSVAAVCGHGLQMLPLSHSCN